MSNKTHVTTINGSVFNTEILPREDNSNGYRVILSGAFQRPIKNCRFYRTTMWFADFKDAMDVVINHRANGDGNQKAVIG